MKCKDLIEHLGISFFESDYLEPAKHNDVIKKLGEQHVFYMLNRTQVMFDYKRLPETIPARNLEIMLQLNGNIFFTKVEEKYYVFTGGLGGKRDVYYEPTIYTVANPALAFSKNLRIGEDGVLIRSDSYGVGLLPMFQKYAALLAENEITMRIATINSRMTKPISAADDRTKASAEKYMEDIKIGKLSVITDNAFLESLKVLQTEPQSSVRFTDLIEFEQYLRAGWFNDLGINANYNMKRESISPNEAQLNDDALLPLVDDMLEMRRLGIEEVNKMYGLDIEVNLSSSWLKEQLDQVVPGVDFDSDGDTHINEEVRDDAEQVTEKGIEMTEEVTEETVSESEDKKQELEDITPDSENISQNTKIKEDLEEIKEDLEEIKEELEEGGETDDRTQETE